MKRNQEQQQAAQVSFFPDEKVQRKAKAERRARKSSKKQRRNKRGRD
jgi:hypothetical protein